MSYAQHHGLEGWNIKEVWFVDDWRNPIAQEGREYYWNSDDALKRLKELKEAGSRDPLVPQRAFVLVSPSSFIRDEHIFILGKDSIVEVRDLFEQSLPPALRWPGISVYDYDREVRAIKRVEKLLRVNRVVTIFAQAFALIACVSMVAFLGLLIYEVILQG